MRPLVPVLLTALGLGTLALLVLTPDVATAQRRGSAQIYITQHRIPRGLSERRLLGWARGHQTTRLQETNEADMNDRKWRADLIVHFRQPPDDLEFHILYYDTQDGARRFVDDQTIYVNDRSQRTYVQRLNLGRPRFAPQRRMEMVVTVRRQEVGRKSFQMLGEERRNTGEVSFSNEEANPGSTMRQQQAQTVQTPVEDQIPEEMSDEELGLSGGGPGVYDDLAPSGDQVNNPGELEPSSERGGCGCSATTSSAAGALVPALALVLIFTRRRRRS